MVTSPSTSTRQSSALTDSYVLPRYPITVHSPAMTTIVCCYGAARHVHYARGIFSERPIVRRNRLTAGKARLTYRFNDFRHNGRVSDEIAYKYFCVRPRWGFNNRPVHPTYTYIHIYITRIRKIRRVNSYIDVENPSRWYYYIKTYVDRP